MLIPLRVFELYRNCDINNSRYSMAGIHFSHVCERGRWIAQAVATDGRQATVVRWDEEKLPYGRDHTPRHPCLGVIVPKWVCKDVLSMAGGTRALTLIVTPGEEAIQFDRHGRRAELAFAPVEDRYRTVKDVIGPVKDDTRHQIHYPGRLADVMGVVGRLALGEDTVVVSMPADADGPIEITGRFGNGLSVFACSMPLPSASEPSELIWRPVWEEGSPVLNESKTAEKAECGEDEPVADFFEPVKYPEIRPSRADMEALEAENAKLAHYLEAWRQVATSYYDGDPQDLEIQAGILIAAAKEV